MDAPVEWEPEQESDWMGVAAYPLLDSSGAARQLESNGASHEGYLTGYPAAQSWTTDFSHSTLNQDIPMDYRPQAPSQHGTSSDWAYTSINAQPGSDYLNGDHTPALKKPPMRTGCISCLIKNIPCDPNNPSCKLAMSDEWNLTAAHDHGDSNDATTSLTLFRPDTKWRRNWRERHSLNFFVTYSAPQMAGFFNSTFWQRLVIQTSFQEPAILHAITAVGALHESILQRAFADEKRKAKAMEFALGQCNMAIESLTRSGANGATLPGPTPAVALATCILFTCFEAMQGRLDSAVTHALQGRRLLQASGHCDAYSMMPFEVDDLDAMQPVVERLDVQATALVDKGKTLDVNSGGQTPWLVPVEYVFGIDHAHNTLQVALNSVMRFMQGIQPTGPKDVVAAATAEKYLRYAPWFQKWETAFSTFLADDSFQMDDMDIKRAMVLKANHLVGSMLASVDPSAGPSAYDPFEAEFQAIVELSRQVLSSFSCPPLPTLHGGASGSPYLSFSLWVTDPLWMAISRCRNPAIRQAAFSLLSQNPRQEGIWHAGPSLAVAQNRPADSPSRVHKSGAKSATNNARASTSRSPNNGTVPVLQHKSSNSSASGGCDEDTSRYTLPEEVQTARVGSKMRARAEWLDTNSKMQQWPDDET